MCNTIPVYRIHEKVCVSRKFRLRPLKFIRDHVLEVRVPGRKRKRLSQARFQVQYSRVMHMLQPQTFIVKRISLISTVV